jgi:hypothetical protein
LGFSEVDSKQVDSEVAQYILSELANGNTEYLKALAHIAHQAVVVPSRSYAEVSAEVDA